MRRDGMVPSHTSGALDEKFEKGDVGGLLGGNDSNSRDDGHTDGRDDEP